MVIFLDQTQARKSPALLMKITGSSSSRDTFFGSRPTYADLRRVAKVLCLLIFAKMDNTIRFARVGSINPHKIIVTDRYSPLPKVDIPNLDTFDFWLNFLIFFSLAQDCTEKQERNNSVSLLVIVPILPHARPNTYSRILMQ